MGHITGLKCKECGRSWPKQPVAACADCWGGLEPEYDWERVRRTFTRQAIALTGTGTGLVGRFSNIPDLRPSSVRTCR